MARLEAEGLFPPSARKQMLWSLAPPPGRRLGRQLKVVFEEAGMTAVTTYINSGNVVFSSRARNPTKLAARLEEAIADASASPFVCSFATSTACAWLWTRSTPIGSTTTP